MKTLAANSTQGRLKTNSHGHEATDKTPAARLGPSAVATATTIAFNPIPRPGEKSFAAAIWSSKSIASTPR